MPTRSIVNRVRKENGLDPLSEDEFNARVAPRTPDPKPEVDQRTIDIRMGLIDPNEDE